MSSDQEANDYKAAWRIAAESADRFRDVITEALGLDENPGDDALVEQLRAAHGCTGPERRKWRDLVEFAESLGAGTAPQVRRLLRLLRPVVAVRDLPDCDG